MSLWLGLALAADLIRHVITTQLICDSQLYVFGKHSVNPDTKETATEETLSTLHFGLNLAAQRDLTLLRTREKRAGERTNIARIRGPSRSHGVKY